MIEFQYLNTPKVYFSITFCYALPCIAICFEPSHAGSQKNYIEKAFDLARLYYYFVLSPTVSSPHC